MWLIFFPRKPFKINMLPLLVVKNWESQTPVKHQGPFMVILKPGVNTDDGSSYIYEYVFGCGCVY